MMDRENVIKGLECCMIPGEGGCDDCSYLGKGMCQELLGEDAISLLKAQEPVVMAGAELTDTELIEKIRKAPFVLKPAVDAIPVEWLDAQIRGYASALKSTELKALVLVKQMWQKEQEAR